ncbi:hypothetical protein [Lentilactobacillus rapi]|uniref:hypothetical protein n=1 Tax=Lentilactobacillus rapi TaxID=481723 RepID=UPI000B02930D|nr:hypothetical protein [Lentilactobacillus rapi]
MTTPIAHLVAAGDSISGGRPGARSESVEEYVNRLKNLERIASEKKGVKESYAIQAGREIRIVVDPKQLDDQQNQKLAEQVKDQIEDELTYPGKIKVTSIRDFKQLRMSELKKKKKLKKSRSGRLITGLIQKLRLYFQMMEIVTSFFGYFFKLELTSVTFKNMIDTIKVYTCKFKRETEMGT